MATYTSIFAKRFRKAIAALKVGIRPAETTVDGSVPLISAGSGAASDADPNGSIYLRTDGNSFSPIYARISGSWEALATTTGLATSVGAGLIGIADTAASLVGTTVEAALAELATPLTLTAGAETSDVIDITVAGPAHVAQYIAQIYTQAGLEAVAANFTMAESGAGAEVSTTGNPTLIFTTDAAGAATLSVTDVMGASGATLFVEVRPASASAGTKAGPAAIVSITFD